MKVVMVEPGQYAQIEELDTGLESLQKGLPFLFLHPTALHNRGDRGISFLKHLVNLPQIRV